MKFVFICGSLEPGQDGVGDYSRRLAAEVIKRGHSAQIVALNDHHLPSLHELRSPVLSTGDAFFESPEKTLTDPEVVCETQSTEGAQVEVLRISHRTSWKVRADLLRELLAYVNPSHLSLQYVPYAYSQKGIPFSLLRCLRRTVGTCRTHVMLHELWIGSHSRLQIKRQFTALAQKLLIRSLLKTLQPVTIHTNLPEYSEKIRQLGFECKGLPIFSNLIESNRVALTPSKQTEELKVGLFSQLTITDEVAHFLQKLQQSMAGTGRQLRITLIGGNAASAETAQQQLSDELGPSVPIAQTGFLSPDQAQAAIRCCTMGISPVPRHAAGKSGSVAAFLAAGIPVALPVVLKEEGKLPSDIGFFHEGLSDACITEPVVSKISEASTAAHKHRREISVAQIAECFLNDLR